MKTPLSSIGLVVIASFIGSFGAVFLKAGSAKLGRGVLSVLVNWRLGIGVFAFLLSSVFFVKGLQHGELSVLYPMCALSYVWTLIWSRLFFQEAFTRGKFLGLGLILLGLTFMGIGNQAAATAQPIPDPPAQTR
jgi:drug/metabolite transporter (DMT)-like permease